MAVVLKKSGLQAAVKFYNENLKVNFDDFKAALDAAIAFQVAGANQAGQRGRDAYASAHFLIFAGLGLGALLCMAVGFALIRAVCTPLGRMTTAMTDLAHGNLATEVPAADRKDEIGKLAFAMTAFKDQLAAAERSKAEQTATIVSSIGTGLDCLAKGDLTHRITAELTGAFAKLKEDFNQALARLQEFHEGGYLPPHQASPRAQARSARPPTICPNVRNSRPPVWKRPPPLSRRSP
jgi:methyl-accepting chemotaxis protein